MSSQDPAGSWAFVAGLGHALRTPLNAIQGFAELLQIQADSLNEKQRQYLERVSTAGQRQLEFINTMVDLARINAGITSLETEPLDTVTMVNDVRRRFDEAARSKQIQLEVKIADQMCPIQGEHDHVKQILSILVDNAVKFTEPDGTVTLSAGMGPVVHPGSTSPEPTFENGCVRITVADTGVGIPLEIQDWIFDDSVGSLCIGERRTQRRGVNLLLANRLVELHGGRIRLESDGCTGHGSVFAVDLPAAVCEPAAADAAAGEVRQ